MKHMTILLIVILFMNTILHASHLKQLKQGKIIIQKIYKGKKNEQITNLQSIVHIMHYVYSKVPAKNQGKEFLSGTILLEDPKYKLFNYLCKYVKKIYPGDMCQENIIQKYAAYPRKSTHFNNYYLYTKKAKKSWIPGLVVKTDCDYVQYGIDAYEEIRLPIKKKHILFGQIGEINGKQMIFIKLEETGMHGMQIVKHTLNLIKKYFSEIRKNLPTDYRREDIPKDLFREFVDLINSKELKLSKKTKQKILDSSRVLGVRKMVTYAQSYTASDQGTSAWRNKMKAFEKKLTIRYPDWQYRFGNEIILMHKELI